MAATTTTLSYSCFEQQQPQQQGQEEHRGQPRQQRGRRRSRQLTGRLMMAVAVAMIALLARGAGAFLVGSAGSSRIAAAVARGGSASAALVELQGKGTRLHSLLDLGSDVGGEIDENSDFYNPDGIQEGDTVEVVKDSVFYSIPKSPKEGVHVKGFQGKVASLKFTAKNGVVCSANRPVLVKFTEPYKFQGHFEFRELKKIV